jgi:hypothetical protein
LSHPRLTVVPILFCDDDIVIVWEIHLVTKSTNLHHVHINCRFFFYTPSYCCLHGSYSTYRLRWSHRLKSDLVNHYGVSVTKAMDMFSLSWSQSDSSLIRDLAHGLIRVTRRVLLVTQELFTFLENLGSPLIWYEGHVAPSLVVCIVCSFVHCIVCPSSIYSFWLHHWYLQTFGHCIVCPFWIYACGIFKHLAIALSVLFGVTPVVSSNIWPLHCLSYD